MVHAVVAIERDRKRIKRIDIEVVEVLKGNAEAVVDGFVFVEEAVVQLARAQGNGEGGEGEVSPPPWPSPRTLIS
jgi:hypothetical protein